ncbi:Asp-tRNA(Asn)/Glu-tRNA(Gln) amidotransferase subunit GatC [Gemmatimonas groenlandica]|uniref:Glutamyl-tRNA(Gln) amidotransferase subunit C n=1 Tax=Gemmatimonas groenlandica TaxID=2732249 RepID=A0A6M4ISE7_9BACT|nr:Asp-tRNA(Asn)/Glu-tRNA(Gln) amidotransferase subunit GatC [Gemmatimonas groenlandica]QJR35151.1 aspartyl/glutamyl-tRNA amidotransferase subunit C [Gemmatimonas groenlandica]
MSVTNDDVLHVAQLARLAIDDARLPGLVAELNGILRHIDALQQAPIPADLGARAVDGMPLRDDDRPSVALQRAREAFAPATRDGFFLVPRLATHGDAGASSEGDA